MAYGENWQHDKEQKRKKNLLKNVCHVKTDVPKKHIYLASQYNELLTVSIQIFNKIRRHQNKLPLDNFAVFPILSHLSKSNTMFES